MSDLPRFSSTAVITSVGSGSFSTLVSANKVSEPSRLQPKAAANDPSTSALAEVSEETGAVVIYVTVPDKGTGEKIGTHLVEKKLAACVNIVPGLTSIYSWKGEINKDEELMLIIKTRKTLINTLTEEVKQLHPYDECEVIALPVIGGSLSYLKWVFDSTSSG